MKSADLLNKTFIFYPEFKGYKQKIFIILFLIILGISLYYLPEIINFKQLSNNILFTKIIGIICIILSCLLYIINRLVISTTKYSLTNKTLIKENGVLSKKVSTLEIKSILDIEIKQNIIENIFRGATIILHTDDITDPLFKIKGLEINYSRQVFELINYFKSLK